MSHKLRVTRGQVRAKGGRHGALVDDAAGTCVKKCGVKKCWGAFLFDVQFLKVPDRPRDRPRDRWRSDADGAAPEGRGGLKKFQVGHRGC